MDFDMITATLIQYSRYIESSVMVGKIPLIMMSFGWLSTVVVMVLSATEYRRYTAAAFGAIMGIPLGIAIPPAVVLAPFLVFIAILCLALLLLSGAIAYTMKRLKL